RFARQEGQQPIVQPLDEMVAIHRRPRITKAAMKPAKATTQNIGFLAPWQNIEAMFKHGGNHAFVGGGPRRSGERLFRESNRADAHSLTSPQGVLFRVIDDLSSTFDPVTKGCADFGFRNFRGRKNAGTARSSRHICNHQPWRPAEVDSGIDLAAPSLCQKKPSHLPPSPGYAVRISINEHTTYA